MYDSETKGKSELESWNHHSGNGKGSRVSIFSIPSFCRRGAWASGCVRVCLHMGVQWQANAKPGLQFLTNTLPIIWSKSFQVPRGEEQGRKRGRRGRGLRSTAKLNVSLTFWPPAALLKLTWAAEKTRTFKGKQEVLPWIYLVFW